MPQNERKGYDTFCAHLECGARFANRSRWSELAALRSGWFVKLDGTAWCPEHVPEWVSAWREAKAKEERYEACLDADD